LQADETTKILHQANLQNIDIRLARSIEHFQIYLIQDKLNITLCKMLTIDYTLLCMHIGSISNQLILLIQFDLTDLFSKK